ncbi:MAG: serine/threonine protein kinase [Deltaproteobacteria bacterium]|nr:serine/threonine protein kinase [Deltaproteobacteria bacterium]
MHREFFENILAHTLMFERYELLRCISAGPYSGVYLCRDQRRENQECVIKVLCKTTCYEQDVLNRFFEEIKIARSVQHPNVMSCNEWMNDDDFVAYTMDYLDGGTLADLIDAKGNTISSAEIVTLLMQLCSGVKAIHKAGIVHRDLKPENILISKEGKLRICDFGIAANMNAPGCGDERSIIGSMNYLSPEYVKDGSFDGRSDIYSIGVIAYELATGRLPFAGEGLLETLRLRVRFSPAPPSSLRSGISILLDRMILKALEKDPAKRYQDCDELLKTLNALKSPASGRDEKVAVRTARMVAAAKRHYQTRLARRRA